jgi:S1-C subfamily serine protease
MRGVSVSVPFATLRRVTEQLMTHGKVRRGFLGVGAQPVRLPDTLAGELQQETGLLLVSVETGSPGEKGGLVLGDTIVSLAGEPVRHLDDLLALLSGDRVGKTVPVQIVRGGKLTEISVAIGERE